MNWILGGLLYSIMGFITLTAAIVHAKCNGDHFDIEATHDQVVTFVIFVFWPFIVFWSLFTCAHYGIMLGASKLANWLKDDAT
jgi:hypothetical protein